MKRSEAERLVGQKLTVRDLMRVLYDVDVYDDVCESLAIAFCNPFDDDEVHDWDEYLTKCGMEQFKEVLDYPMEIYYGCVGGCMNAIVHIDDDDDKVWKRRLRKAEEFFESAAGYCSCEDYDKWFKM